MKYSVDDLVKLAKRDGNSIRPYLYVNPIQGKHIPSKSRDVMGMCKEIANKVNRTYPNDKLYVIGFAETATGIAAAISHFLKNIVYYQNTTREYRDEEDYLFFTESHSHATDQMLRTSGVKDCLERVDRIIFVDDEITTGKTICKLIDRIKNEYHTNKLAFTIVSVLNSMEKKRLESIKQEGIDCIYLSSIPFEYRKDSIINIEVDNERNTIIEDSKHISCEELDFECKLNPRSVVSFKEYDYENNRFSELIMNTLGKEHYKKVLLLGTEEFMYPAIYSGERIKEARIASEVWVHATTRSPIIVSGMDGYPLFHRYQLRSIYEESRTTFVYNLKKYDKVIIVSDSMRRTKGKNDIVAALESAGNESIILAHWVYTI